MPTMKKLTKNIGLDKDAYINSIPYLEVDTLANVILGSPGWETILADLQPQTETSYPNDPVEFMTKTLGYLMWDKIAEICHSVEQNKHTVVASGFGIGKSISAASLACWWMTTKKPAIVIVIGPSHNSVQNILFRYIRTVARKAKLPGTVYDTPRWEVASDHYAIGLSPRRSTAEDVTTIQGIHGENVLVIMDEAAGLPKIIWDTVSGLTVGSGCRTLAIANPIEQAGPFWDALNSRNWHPITVSCLQHPNVVTGVEVVPGAVTRKWIEERCNEWAIRVEPETPEAVHIPWLNEWYKPLPIFQAKVLGMAPEQAEDQLIHLAWVVAAQERTIDERNAETVIGFDPAPRGGDDNAICTRHGNRVEKVERFKSQDTQALANILQMRVLEAGAVKVYIDDIGSGAGVTDRARKLGLPVFAVNFSRSASQRHRFANLRSECWWRLRELLREGKIQLPLDHILAGDLTAPKYRPDDYGRILLESKDDIRARINRSPDSGDALALTYAVAQGDSDVEEIANRLATLGQSTGAGNSRWLISRRKGMKSRWRN